MTWTSTEWREINLILSPLATLPRHPVFLQSSLQCLSPHFRLIISTLLKEVLHHPRRSQSRRKRLHRPQRYLPIDSLSLIAENSILFLVSWHIYDLILWLYPINIILMASAGWTKNRGGWISTGWYHRYGNFLSNIRSWRRWHTRLLRWYGMGILWASWFDIYWDGRGFVCESPSWKASELKIYRAAKDLARLSSLGHFLKGSSAALGVAKVQASCERIQHYGQRRDEEAGVSISDGEALDRIESLLAQVKKEYEDAEKWLKDWYRQRGVEPDE